MFPKWFMLINLLFSFAHVIVGIHVIYRKTSKEAKWLPRRVTDSKKSMIYIGLYEIITGLLFFTILTMSLLEFTIVEMSVVLSAYMLLSLMFWIFYRSKDKKLA